MSERGDQRKFIREIERAGGVVREGRGDHKLVFVNGVHVATVSRKGAQGYSNDRAATRRALRKAGLKL
jgi:hypothetical protein